MFTAGEKTAASLDVFRFVDPGPGLPSSTWGAGGGIDRPSECDGRNAQRRNRRGVREETSHMGKQQTQKTKRKQGKD